MYTDQTAIPVIDTHVHVFPQKLFLAVREWFETYAWKFHDQGTVDDLVGLQFENGAAGLVLMGYAHRPGAAEMINRTTGRLLRAFPHTAGLAAVHPEDDHPGDILKQAREEFGLCGVKMHCHVMRRAPDDPLLFPIYEDLCAWQGILNIHAGREPAIDAYGVDVRALSGAARVENVLKRFPEMKVIIPHLGFDEMDEFYNLLETYPNLYLDTTMILGGFFQVDVDRSKLIRHADRVLYGSDYPHIPYDMETEVRALLALDPGEGPLRQILHDNAKRLFPITTV
jgi:predicted TIM-barrel fold metal-dependent hydrolase